MLVLTRRVFALCASCKYVGGVLVVLQVGLLRLDIMYVYIFEIVKWYYHKTKY